MLVWALGEVILGVDLRQPSFSDAPPEELGGGMVLTAATVNCLIGWAVLAACERLTVNPRRPWTVIATLVLVLSLVAPLSGDGVSDGNRAILVAIHLIAGATMIAGIRRTTADSPGG